MAAMAVNIEGGVYNGPVSVTVLTNDTFSNNGATNWWRCTGHTLHTQNQNDNKKRP